jgi:putative transcriptional regulator
MLSLKINQKLQEMDKSVYWLSKTTGISEHNMHKICKNGTSTIRFDTLEKICKALECSPNELFDSDDSQMQHLLNP